MLKKKIEEKKWNKDKIQENYEAELIGLISWEAHKNHKKVYEIDTTEKKPEEVAEEIIKKFKPSIVSQPPTNRYLYNPFPFNNQ